VLFDFALSEGLVNGDFERIRDSGTESGWSFHGGSLNGSFGTDSTTYLILGGGQSALHNRFYLPTGVLGIQLCSKVSVASASDTVSMLLTSPSFPDRELLSADQQDLTNPSDWECFQAPILASEAGSIAQIQLSVTSQASPTVFFDDIQIIMSLFSDGFETGTTLPWSETIP
jgi:hypothetical protein